MVNRDTYQVGTAIVNSTLTTVSRYHQSNLSVALSPKGLNPGMQASKPKQLRGSLFSTLPIVVAYEGLRSSAESQHTMSVSKTSCSLNAALYAAQS